MNRLAIENLDLKNVIHDLRADALRKDRTIIALNESYKTLRDDLEPKLADITAKRNQLTEENARLRLERDEMQKDIDGWIEVKRNLIGAYGRGDRKDEVMINEGLSSDHPLMKAWNEFCGTDEFMNALKWSCATKYDDGRPISDIQREQHVKGGLWIAFTKGMVAMTPETKGEQMSTLGRIAYEAYRAKSGGKSLISGADIPGFDALPEAIKQAWEAAGDAVAASVGRADAGSVTQ